MRPRAESRRRSGNPLRLVLSIGTAGSLLLGGTWLWLDGLGGRVTALGAAQEPVPVRRPVLSARRTATVLSRVTRAGRVDSRIDQVRETLPDGSCLVVRWLGETVVSERSDESFVPGSVMKLVTAAAALSVLGADTKFATSVRVARNPDGSVGDLYLVGGGDPLLTRDEYVAGEKYASFNNTRLESLADRIVGAGVTAVTGRVVGVDTLFDGERYVNGWPDSFHGVESGPLGALMVNDGAVVGQPTKPDDPALAAAQELVALLAARGVTVAAGAAHDVLPEETAELFVQESAPVRSVVQEMLVNSDNNTAEILLKHIGLARKGTGSTAAGITVVTGLLEEWGVSGGVKVADGSGLSSANRLSCSAVMRILALNSGNFPALLAVAGRTGTLREMFADTPAEGLLVGKTGTLSGVKSLAGYVPVDGEVPLEFALLMNRAGIDNRSAYRPVWNRLADSIGRASAEPRPTDLAP